MKLIFEQISFYNLLQLYDLRGSQQTTPDVWQNRRWVIRFQHSRGTFVRFTRYNRCCPLPNFEAHKEFLYQQIIDGGGGCTHENSSSRNITFRFFITRMTGNFNFRDNLIIMPKNKNLKSFLNESAKKCLMIDQEGFFFSWDSKHLVSWMFYRQNDHFLLELLSHGPGIHKTGAASVCLFTTLCWSHFSNVCIFLRLPVVLLECQCDPSDRYTLLYCTHPNRMALQIWKTHDSYNHQFASVISAPCNHLCPTIQVWSTSWLVVLKVNPYWQSHEFDACPMPKQFHQAGSKNEKREKFIYYLF